MESPLIFYEFKKQAYSFFKDKLKTARLALTDVTPVQLMTEDATDGNIWPLDTRAIGVISRSAFEVDDYWRIVEILHARLLNFDRKNWRESYKVLILLEHLLTHGPLRIADEFKDDKQAIDQIGNLQYIDEKGFNWGLSVNKLSERVLKLIENSEFLKEERHKSRKLTRGIQGFGSFINHSSSGNEATKDFSIKLYGRSNSQYNTRQKVEAKSFEEYEFCGTRPNAEKIDENSKENHPFCDDENETKKYLLSCVNSSAKQRQFGF